MFVRIESEGLFRLNYNPATKNHDRFIVKETEIITCLRGHCEITEGVTLLDIFRMVDSYPVLKDFVAKYSWCSKIDEFHAQAEEPMRSEQGANPIDYLEIRHVLKATECKQKGQTTNRFENSGGFHGISRIRDLMAYRNQMGCEPPIDGLERYSVSYTPMYDLADLPVKLNPRINICYIGEQHGIKEDFVSIGDFSLLEILNAIYDDISFGCGPPDNADFIAGLNDEWGGLDEDQD